MWLKKIVSGGQTGVDRAGLDAAIQHRINHGGWCPRDRRAEDGIIDSKYHLIETDSRDYKIRTECNVRDSDGTLILNIGTLEGGTAFTAAVAATMGKPCLIIDLSTTVETGKIKSWLTGNQIHILNIAGPRESKCPGIYARALDELNHILLSIINP